jgi:hypothetical protein
MNPTYEFHFFNPHRTATRSESLTALESLGRSGSRVSRFRRGVEFVQVQPGTAVRLEDLVAENGKVLADLYTTTPTNQRLDYLLAIHPPAENGRFARLVVEAPYLKEDSSAVATMLDLVKLLNLHLPVWFARGDHELNLNHLESQLSLERVSALAWANLFCREFVEHVGQTFLAQAPSYQTLTFKRGVLLLLSPSPLVKPDANLLQRVQAYFGLHAVSTGP